MGSSLRSSRSARNYFNGIDELRHDEKLGRAELTPIRAAAQRAVHNLTQDATDLKKTPPQNARRL
jgi:hypothetical protein